jgi:hypothetical protein
VFLKNEKWKNSNLETYAASPWKVYKRTNLGGGGNLEEDEEEEGGGRWFKPFFVSISELPPARTNLLKILS